MAIAERCDMKIPRIEKLFDQKTANNFTHKNFQKLHYEL